MAKLQISEPITRLQLNGQTIKELRDLARGYHIPAPTKMVKAELIDAILAALPTQDAASSAHAPVAQPRFVLPDEPRVATPRTAAPGAAVTLPPAKRRLTVKEAQSANGETASALLPPERPPRPSAPSGRNSSPLSRPSPPRARRGEPRRRLRVPSLTQHPRRARERHPSRAEPPPPPASQRPNPEKQPMNPAPPRRQPRPANPPEPLRRSQRHRFRAPSPRRFRAQRPNRPQPSAPIPPDKPSRAAQRQRPSPRRRARPAARPRPRRARQPQHSANPT